MDKKHRYIYFYDLKIKTETTARKIQNIAQLSLMEILGIIDKNNPKNKHFSYLKDSVHFYIADWRFDVHKNQYHVLINKSDRNSANPIFTDPTKIDERNEISRREVERSQEEGLDQSSHIIIQLDTNSPTKGLLLLERGALAGAYYLQTLLTRLINDSRKDSPDYFVQNHPSGALIKGVPQLINTYYSVNIDGHISTSFVDDLNSGDFKELVLISENPVAQTVDKNILLVEKTETIRLTTNHSVSSRLKEIVRIKAKDYSKARIRFKNVNGTERDIEVSTQDFDPSDYVRRELIESKTASFQSSYKIFNATVINLMQKLLTQ